MEAARSFTPIFSPEQGVFVVPLLAGERRLLQKALAAFNPGSPNEQRLRQNCVDLLHQPLGLADVALLRSLATGNGTSPPKPTRTSTHPPPHLVAQRREKVRRLSGERNGGKGHYQRPAREIAELLGCSVNTVQRDRWLLSRQGEARPEAPQARNGSVGARVKN